MAWDGRQMAATALTHSLHGDIPPGRAKVLDSTQQKRGRIARTAVTQRRLPSLREIPGASGRVRLRSNRGVAEASVRWRLATPPNDAARSVTAKRRCPPTV
jgi:hypothetical protein